MSKVNDKLMEIKGSVKESGVANKVKTGLMVAGGIALGAGATYLIMNHVNVPAMAKTAVDAAPEVAEAVAETAEAVL